MPRRSILSAAERESLGIARCQRRPDPSTRSATNDLSIIRQHRGPCNRLGFAVQLCYPDFRHHFGR